MVNNNKLKWYIVVTYNGYEDKVKEAIWKTRESLGWEDLIEDIKIVKTILVNPKTKRERLKNVYPGYVFVKSLMTNDVWFQIRNTTGVTGFVGSSGKGAKPLPLNDIEANKMLNQAENMQNDKKILINFKEGDYVTTINKDNVIEGIVKKIDFAKGHAIVETELFGRSNTVELDLQDIKKQ